MKMKNHLAAFSVVAVLAITGTVTSPVWAQDGHDDECVPSLSSRDNPYCPDDTEPPYPTDTPTTPTETPTTTPPTTTPPTTTPPTTTPPTTTPPTTTPPTTTPPTTTPPTTPPPTTPAPTTPVATTTPPAPTPTTTVSPSTAATSSPTPETESPTPEIQQTTTVPVVTNEVVPTSINAGAGEEDDDLVGLPLGLATLGVLLGLFALVARRRHS